MRRTIRAFTHDNGRYYTRDVDDPNQPDGSIAECIAKFPPGSYYTKQTSEGFFVYQMPGPPVDLGLHPRAVDDPAEAATQDSARNQLRVINLRNRVAWQSGSFKG